MGARNQVNRERWETRLRLLGLSGKFPDRLTERVVQAAMARPLGERYPLACGEVSGLYLLVGKQGEATYWLHYRTRDHARRQYKVGKAGDLTLEAARKKARTTIAKVENGGDPAQEEQEQEQASMTFGDYFERIYKPRIVDHYSPTNRENTRTRISSVWKPLFQTPLARITREAIEQIQLDRKAAGIKVSTLRRDWADLRSLLRNAIERGGYLEKMPITKKPEPLRKTDESSSRVRYLGQRDTEQDIARSQGERERFEKALEAHSSSWIWGGDFLRTTVRIALSTGMRRTEILSIKEAWIDWRRGTLTLPPSVTKAGKERVVHLNADAQAALRAWPVREFETGKLFPGKLRTHWSRISGFEFPQLRLAARIQDFHFHDLRHDFASRLAMAGVPILAIKEALGHGSVVMTERYAHLSPNVTRDAVLALSRAR